jgi:hypothetical protein
MLDDQTLIERFRGIFADIMDPYANIVVAFNGGAALLTCFWPIVSDPERPHKTCVPIRIAVEQSITEMLRADEDFTLSGLEEEMQDVAAHRMQRYSPDPENRSEADTFDIHIHAVDLHSFQA